MTLHRNRNNYPYPPLLSHWRASARWLLNFGLLLSLLLIHNSGSAVAQTGPQETPPTHTVGAGETLSQIAESYGISLAELLTYNGIRDADSVGVGRELRLPAPGPPVTVEPALPAQPQTVGQIVNLNRTVSVRPDDNLGRIALRYGVDLSALLALNGLSSAADIIRAGQELLLPATIEDLLVADPDRVYVVQPGESLGLIAQAHNISVSELMAVNRIGDPNTVQPNQELVIPGEQRAGQASSVGPARAGFYYHNVQPGETMSQLAQIYDTTPQAIVRYNGLPDEKTIYAGLEVRIPYGPPVLNRLRLSTPETGSEFVVSITRQRCWVMQNGAILHDWRCSTGQGQWATRTGTFAVKTKLEMAKSSAYRLDMPFWLGIYDVGAYENGIHGLPVEWSTGEKLWDTLVGQPATFGCAMLLDEDAATLFALSYLGMPVHIVD
ncbi:MAG: LysM peptidoglycan-binding domain-containing protein [Chloroflexi bacterium]|nr:MAG: LysM peptidoglycan-binding domain-containing protein [Chloroflexota bacterium]